jgi:hypothetical protein
MICIGCDPGKSTGIAIAQNGKIVELLTTDFWGSVDIFNAYPNATVVIELPNTKHVWHKSSNEKTTQRTGVNVGSCIREAELLIKWLHKESRNYIIQKPKGKLNAGQFNKITGWTKQSNQHERDAGILVHGFMLLSRPD